MRLDIIVAKAIEYRRQGDGGMWGLALLASRVIDGNRYGEGSVIEFSRAIKRSGRRVYDLARAWTTYDELRPEFEANFQMWPQVKRWRDVRNSLPCAHFEQIGALIRRLEFSPSEAIGYLVDAMELGYSADRMADSILADQNGHKRPPDREREFSREAARALDALEKAGFNAPTEDVGREIARHAAEIRRAVEAQADDEPAWHTPARFARSSLLELSGRGDIPAKLVKSLETASAAIEKAMEDKNEK